MGRRRLVAERTAVGTEGVVDAVRREGTSFAIAVILGG